MPDFDFSEVDWVAFRLKGNEPALDHKVCPLDEGFGVFVTGIVLGHLVADDLFPVDEVIDHPAAMHLDLGGDPLITMKGLRSRIGAVGLVELVLVDDMGSRCAKIAGGPGIFPVPSQILHFDGHRKILVLEHGFGVLAMDHHPGIPKRPTRATLALVPDKPVFHPEPVVGETLLEKEVPEAFAKIIVFVVPDLDHPVADPESVPVIVAKVGISEFGSPPIQGFAIKEAPPLPGGFGKRDGGGDNRCGQQSPGELTTGETHRNILC